MHHFIDCHLAVYPNCSEVKLHRRKHGESFGMLTCDSSKACELSRSCTLWSTSSSMFSIQSLVLAPYVSSCPKHPLAVFFAGWTPTCLLPNGEWKWLRENSSSVFIMWTKRCLVPRELVRDYLFKLKTSVIKERSIQLLVTPGSMSWSEGRSASSTGIISRK